MHLIEFITLATRRQLVFRQFRDLERNDKAEGKVPSGFWEAFERDANQRGVGNAELAATRQQAERALDRLLYFTYVSCWTMSVVENALLWQVYAPHGVAIRTRVDKLKRAAENTQTPITSAGMVYANDWRDLEAQGVASPIARPISVNTIWVANAMIAPAMTEPHEMRPVAFS